MVKGRALGKGLASLIPQNEEALVQQKQIFTPEEDATIHTPVSETTKIPTDALVPNRYQPRKDMDEEKLNSLVESIRQHGIIQPILVRDTDRGKEIVAGERRWRAAKTAGLAEVPVRALEITDAQAMELALVENLQREDLNPVEIARGIYDLTKQFRLTHDEIAQRLGWSRAAISNKLRILQLPKDALKLVIDGSLSEGHARCLLTLPDRNAILNVARVAIQEGFSVRQLEEYVKTYGEEPEIKTEEIIEIARDKSEVYPLPDLLRKLCAEKKMKIKITGSPNGLNFAVRGLKYWQIQILLEYFISHEEEFFPEG